MPLSLPSRRSLALVWALALALLTAALMLRLSGSVFDSSILALLPEDQQAPLVARASDRMDEFVAKRVLLLVGGSRADRPELSGLAEDIARQLSESGAFSRVRTRAEADWWLSMGRLYQPYHYQLLTDDVRQRLAGGQGNALVAEAARGLVSPASGPHPAPLLDDPLNLLGHWLRSLDPGGGFQLDQQGLFVTDSDRHYRVITAVIKQDPFDQATQKRVLAAVAEADARVSDSAVASELLRSGLVFHAAAGASQARAELSTIGVGSLIAILLLLWWQFRSVSYLLLPVLSIGCGLLVALSVSLVVFERVHLVTLAFGASLVGVSVDYAFHYLCHVRYQGGAGVRRILPGITLGLLSSCLAYGAQALTPFPGLQQIALFSAAGLIGAWLTVVLWFPVFGRWLPARRTEGWLGRGLVSVARLKKPLVVVLAGLLALALYGLPGVVFDDSLGALQSSPESLLRQEQRIQSLSENPGSARFLLIRGNSAQQVLEREERARLGLDQLVRQGRLDAYRAVSGFAPSIDRQQKDRQRVAEQVYQAGLPERLFQSVGMSGELAGRSEARFRAAEPRWLRPSELADAPVGELLSAQWLEPLPGSEEVASLITLGGAADRQVYQQLAELADGIDGVRFVDRVERTSDLLAGYRATVSQWTALAYALVLLVLFFRYGRGCWRVILPPALATLMTLGLLSVMGLPLNLFNLLAALLILGIGLDIGIFVRESGGQLHAWEAVTLSALTSLLAFGLLALSETPVLHHFGMTVLPGIGLAWLIAFVLGSGALAGSRVSKGS